MFVGFKKSDDQGMDCKGEGAGSCQITYIIRKPVDLINIYLIVSCGIDELVYDVYEVDDGGVCSDAGKFDHDM
jgi:hypothetical protein